MRLKPFVGCWVLMIWTPDADKTEHAGIVTFGNDKTNWWAAVPAMIDPKKSRRHHSYCG